MADWYDEARKYIKTKVTSSDNSFGGLMAAWFRAGAPNNASGAVVITPQVEPAAATSTYNAADFNGLVAKLVAAGVLTSA